MKLKEYVGQETLKALLKPELDRSRYRPMRHILLTGGPGYGKSALAGAIADDLGYLFYPTTGCRELTSKRLYQWMLSMPTNGYDRQGRRLGNGKIVALFIDEVHKLPEYEMLYEAMTDCQVSMLGRVNWLPDFTLIACTTELYKLPYPFVSRFGIQHELTPYSSEELCTIIMTKFPAINRAVVEDIAVRSRHTPRLALGYAESVQRNPEFFALKGIDENGLTPNDRKYLELLGSGTKSLGTLAYHLGMPAKSVETQIEPYLLSQGLIEITGRGRMLTGQDERGIKTLEQFDISQLVSI